jgi:3-(3-hydroxy-phenyl)propionate hydroxylase
MRYDALIVGFGPVGATLANLLARCGLSVGVVEAEAHIYDKPRAITFDHEVMRIFQFCGLADRILPFTAPRGGTHYLGIDGSVIRRLDPLPPPYPLAWPPTSSFVQPELERVLREGATEYAGIDVWLRHQALAFTQDDEGVSLTVRDLAHGTRGTQRNLQARVLLGCDGANSFVRRTLDVAVEDLGFDEWWMVVDTRIVAPVELPPQGIQYCWPSRPSTYVPGPGTLRRWEIKLLPGEDPEEFGRHENVVRQIGRFANPACLEIWRSAVYRFHALLAQQWRYGRVFLLGDACHQTPPFLGQGLCAGIRDAANLAWKLAMVLQEGASPALLDSYEQERKPHVRSTVATAKALGLVIGELDPEAARIRDETLHAQLARGEVETIRQRLIPNLEHGVIDREPAALGAGMLFVQPRVRRITQEDTAGEPVLLENLLRFRFLIVTSSEGAQTWLSTESLALWRRLQGERIVIGTPGQRRSLPHVAPGEVLYVEETDTLFADWMSQMGCAAVVVRPDRCVFGAAADAAQLNRLVAAVGRHVFGVTQTNSLSPAPLPQAGEGSSG